MTDDDLKHAFAHPTARSEATAEAPCDRISVRDHILTVEIGAFQAERGTTQRIRFDVVVEVQPLSDEIDDDVDRILSYDRVTEAIEAALSEERLEFAGNFGGTCCRAYFARAASAAGLCAD